MPSPSIPRILILTAGFGEGHNSAAKHLALALKGRAEARIYDPCEDGAPRVNGFLQNFYRLVTTHTPSIWKRIYDSTDKQDFSKQSLPLMRKPEDVLTKTIDEFKPDAIVSTYPLYPYFCERIFSKLPRVPVFTVITDSIEINASWRKAPTDFFLITDEMTKDGLTRQEMSPDTLIITGFPVHTRFAHEPPLPADTPTSPFRVLYFPTAKKPHVRRIMRALLETHPDVEITVVLGKNVRSLYKRAHSIKAEFPGRVRLKGWTKKVPELLLNHHLVIGKAGGATVHEAIAAQCPMLIHHLVPGQEEGNLQLLEHIGAGQLTDTPQEVRSTLSSILANDAKLWREMKRKLTRHSKPNAANTAATFILNHLS